MSFEKESTVFSKEELDDDLGIENDASLIEILATDIQQTNANKRKGQRSSQYDVEVRRTVEDILDRKRQREKFGDDIFDD